MLNKRTNIMFDENVWRQLVSLAKEKEASVGELIRTAVVTLYIDDDKNIARKRLEAHESIKKIRSGIKHKFTNRELKKLINYGRKY
jgi:hypothetical protein